MGVLLNSWSSLWMKGSHSPAVSGRPLLIPQQNIKSFYNLSSSFGFLYINYQCNKVSIPAQAHFMSNIGIGIILNGNLPAHFKSFISLLLSMEFNQTHSTCDCSSPERFNLCTFIQLLSFFSCIRIQEAIVTR